MSRKWKLKALAKQAQSEALMRGVLSIARHEPQRQPWVTMSLALIATSEAIF